MPKSKKEKFEKFDVKKILLTVSIKNNNYSITYFLSPRFAAPSH